MFEKLVYHYKTLFGEEGIMVLTKEWLEYPELRDEERQRIRVRHYVDDVLQGERWLPYAEGLETVLDYILSGVREDSEITFTDTDDDDERRRTIRIEKIEVA